MANDTKTLKKFTVQILDEQGQPNNVPCNFDDSLVPGLNDRVEELETKTDSMSSELETAADNIEKLDDSVGELSKSLDEKLSKADFSKTPASAITAEQIERWNNPVGAEEKDPLVPSWVKAITEEQIAKWDAGEVSYKSTYLANLKDMRSVDLLNSRLITFDPTAVGSQYTIDESIVIPDTEEPEETDVLSDETEDEFAQLKLGPHFYDYARGTYELCNLQENDIIFFYADSLAATAVVVRHSDGMKYLRDISGIFDIQDYYLDDTDERSTTKYKDTEKENGTLRLVPVILYLADQYTELENRVAVLEEQIHSQPEPEPEVPTEYTKELSLEVYSADIIPEQDPYGTTNKNCVLQYKFDCADMAGAKHITVANASFDFSTDNGGESGTFSQASDGPYQETDLMKTSNENQIRFYDEENDNYAYMYVIGDKVACDIPWYFPGGATNLDSDTESNYKNSTIQGKLPMTVTTI